jgi:hypothetical protein
VAEGIRKKERRENFFELGTFVRFLVASIFCAGIGLWPAIARSEFGSRAAWVDLATRFDSYLLQDEVLGSRHKAFSTCAIYAFLLSELYAKNALDLEPTLQEAVYLAADHQFLLSNFARGLPETRKYFPELAGDLNYFFQSSTLEVLDLRLQTSKAGRLQIAQKFREHYPKLPDWLIAHGGGRDLGMRKGNSALKSDRQGPENGYWQAPGDSDRSGRHDHLVANMILGYHLQQQIAQDTSKSLTPGTKFLYREVGAGIGLANEIIGQGQNKSRTDAWLNMRASRLGAAWYWSPPKTSAVFNREIYKLLCDENSLSLKFRGPLKRDQILEFLKL